MGLWKDKARNQWRYDFQYKGERYTGKGYRTKKEAAAAEAAKRKKLKRPNQKTRIGMGFSEACNLYLDISEKAHAVKTFKYKKSVYIAFAKFLGIYSPEDDVRWI